MVGGGWKSWGREEHSAEDVDPAAERSTRISLLRWT